MLKVNFHSFFSFILSQHGGARTCRNSRNYDGFHAHHWFGCWSRIFVCDHPVSLKQLYQAAYRSRVLKP